MPELTHLDEHHQPRMVDVSEKTPTERRAHARAVVRLPQPVLDALNAGDIQTKKGPVIQTAIIAGTMAVKKTSELIPFCHPLQIEGCKFSILIQNDTAVIDCEVKVFHKTGIEMEALTGATVAALTIYDMCKGLSHNIVIEQVSLIEKRGGKSDYNA